MADFSKIIDSQKDLFAAWEGFQVLDAKIYDENSSVSRLQLFAVNQEEKEEKAHEGFVACVKAWANWFFDAVIKLITCKHSEIKARPACCWTKLNVTEVKFNISGGDSQSLEINRLVECALKSIGVANPEEVAEEVAGEKGDAKSAKASPQKSPSKKGEAKKEEVKSPLDANMEAFEKAVKEASIDVSGSTLARFTFRVIDGNKAGTLEFLAKGADFSDKDAKIFKFTVKA